MKKGIVLLVSLFFIGTISLLIFENIKTTDILIKESNDDFINTQALISMRNYRDEIGKLLLKNRDNINDLLQSSLLSDKLALDMKNIKANVKVVKYENIYDINALISGNESQKRELEDFFLSSGVDFDALSYFVNNYMEFLPKEQKSINSFFQLNQVISEFIKSSNTYEIEEIRDKIGYFKVSETSKFVLCNLDMDIHGKMFNSSFIYDLDSSKENDIKVKDFDFIFR